MFQSRDKISQVSKFNSARGFPSPLVKQPSCSSSRRSPSFVQYIALDGDSLTTEDLVNLGKGRYKIKVQGKVGKDAL